MKSVLKYILILITGALIGILGMYFLNSPETVVETIVEIQPTDDKNLQNQQKKIKKTLDLPVNEEVVVEDSIESVDSLPVIDSLIIRDTLSSSEEEEYLEIVSERLISKRNVTIEVIQPDSLDTSDLLNLKADSYSKNLVVEFWESPLDLIGYELNRSRLKLFGFNSNEIIEIKRAYDSEKLTVEIGSTNNVVVLKLEKSPKFKSIILK